MESRKYFSTKIGFLLSALGIAIGTGNIWPFPRIAAQNGSENGAGALIIAWIIFLFIWSIPLIITEYFLGRKYRIGLVGVANKSLGKQFAWVGGFIAVVAAGISFFYAVVVGWSIYHLIYYIFNSLPNGFTESQQVWENFQLSIYPFCVLCFVVILGIWAVWNGVQSIEKVNKILIPVLLLIIIVAFLRTLFLPGALDGISFLFRIDKRQFYDTNIWLQALTQNAWDTGAGWGLFLTYAIYMKNKYSIVKNAFATGIGNNTISIIMAIIIFGTVFSTLQFSYGYNNNEILEVMKTSGPASTGLTFIWMPLLFSQFEIGSIITVLFFLGLSFAGFSSLISMYEMSSTLLINSGLQRRKSVTTIGILSLLAGIPSAFSVNFLSNQDFVWGIGLIISGVLIVMMALKHKHLISELGSLKPVNDWKAGNIWYFLIKFLIPILGSILIIWWIVQSATVFDPKNWFNPFKPFTAMTCILQWIVAILILISVNKILVRHLGKK